MFQRLGESIVEKSDLRKLKAVPKELFKPMKLTLVRSLTAAAVLASALAVAQTDPPASSAAALPAAPSAASSNTPTAIPTGGGSKIGTINIEAAIFASNEGQRDGEAVAQKLQPKQNEL